MIRSISLCLLLASPAMAGVDSAVEDHILHGLADFTSATRSLADAAEDTCTANTLRPGYNDAFDAWLGVQHLRFGPIEADGRALAIAFWPDTRGMVQFTVASLLADTDEVVQDPDDFAEVSVAGRGLFALERLIYGDGSDYGQTDYACRYAQAIATDLALMADQIESEWRDGYADTLRTAGNPENQVFLTEREAAQALYTALTTGLEFDADQRVGRPLGTFDRPRPERAEARRSNRSLANVTVSLRALREFADALADGPIPATLAAFDDALAAAQGLDPVFADVTDPQARLETEILQQRIKAIQAAIAGEIGTELGVAAGFNSSDGD